MAREEKLQTTAAAFAVLLTTVTEMLRASGDAAVLLDAYDDASDRILSGLRANDVPDQHVQSVHKGLARLRLALERKK